MPCLNEAWAGVYLQVAATILVFGVGIPSLVLQTIVPEDLRLVVHRQWRLLRWGAYLVLVYVFITILFVWLLHPCNSETYGPPVGLRAATLISLAILGVFSVPVLLAFHRRHRVFKRLACKCKRHIWRGGTPHESALEDIQYLGERGKAGHEKKLALKILDELARQVQRHRGYPGNSLGGIIKAIEGTLREGANVENFLDDGIPALSRIIGRLQDVGLSSHPDMGLVMRALQRLGCTTVKMDLVPPDPALGIVDAVAFAGQGPNGSLAMASEALFTLGSAALKHKRYLVAIAALNKIEVLRDECTKKKPGGPDAETSSTKKDEGSDTGRVPSLRAIKSLFTRLFRSITGLLRMSSVGADKGIDTKEPLTEEDRKRLIAETLADYYGLVAHFWAAGPTARDRVRISLQSVEDEPLEERLRQAREHHASNARFDTADKLAAMIEDVRAGLLDI